MSAGFTPGPWRSHDGGSRPVAPGTKVQTYFHRSTFEPLEADKMASHIQLASSVDWTPRPGDQMKYRIVGKSADEIAAELRVRDLAPDLLAKLEEVAERGENYDGDDWAMFTDEAAALIAKARGEQ